MKHSNKIYVLNLNYSKLFLFSSVEKIKEFIIPYIVDLTEIKKLLTDPQCKIDSRLLYEFSDINIYNENLIDMKFVRQFVKNLINGEEHSYSALDLSLDEIKFLRNVKNGETFCPITYKNGNAIIDEDPFLYFYDYADTINKDPFYFYNDSNIYKLDDKMFKLLEISNNITPFTIKEMCIDNDDDTKIIYEFPTTSHYSSQQEHIEDIKFLIYFLNN